MVVTSTDISGLKKFISGKVRDVYDLGDELLVIATDRISAFDVIMPTGIPNKGKVLTQISLFWFDLTKDIVENHLITADTDDIIDKLTKLGLNDTSSLRNIIDGRSMIVRKAKCFPVECIVRGYISGSAWSEYKKLTATTINSSINLYGHILTKNLKESDILPEPIFTPSTKAHSGHDINIDQAEMKKILGYSDASELIEKSLLLYKTASEYALSKGIIIADTKFEFGKIDDKIIVIDEVLTPDSSRFWDVETYRSGGTQPSFDKQFVRDWLISIDFNKEPPGPVLPVDIVSKTADKYQEAYHRITGKSI